MPRRDASGSGRSVKGARLPATGGRSRLARSMKKPSSPNTGVRGEGRGSGAPTAMATTTLSQEVQTGKSHLMP